MNRTFFWALVAPVLAGAQNPDPGLQFEAAVVKVHHGASEKSSSPGQFSVSGISLKGLLLGAYGITTFQLDGPGWMDSEAYDVVAKLAPGVTEPQRRVMMQNLLTERFQIRLHHEQRNLNQYKLMLGHGGLKLKAASPDAKPDWVSKRVALNGHGTMVAEHCSMAHLAEVLSEELGEPVKDGTGAAGLYAFSLEFARGSATDGTPLPVALQGLGLRLETRKAPMDVLVIDHAEKVPVEK